MIPYTLIRSKRKTLALEITKESILVVRAPQRLPQAEIDRFVKQKEEWILCGLEKQRQRLENHPKPDLEQQKMLLQQAQEQLPERVAYYAKQMGLSPTGITITGAATRFGSCSAKNRLCFSWRLMQYPQEAVDYVVVHELAHIVHKNHGKEFYALVESVLPDYKERWQMLKE
ncbi:M48 family metallopeptidase [Clostridium minihomine]|uniref:M48 family metallopeptidase n=1 Tax=Clostridium minihomine TaxID=2045012 RepID=UPI000C776BC3|nr:M48 family metallopeptidase [Clostridium minihomine]